MSTLGRAEDFEVSMSDVEAHFYTLKDRIAERDREIVRLRAVLTEVADTLEKSGRFPNSVSVIRAALNGAQQVVTPGATFAGEGSVGLHDEPSRPQELLGPKRMRWWQTVPKS